MSYNKEAWEGRVAAEARINAKYKLPQCNHYGGDEDCYYCRARWEYIHTERVAELENCIRSLGGVVPTWVFAHDLG